MIYKHLFIAIILLAVCVGCVPSEKTGLYAVVEWVADGDTVKLDNGRFVRYIGINTPEVHHPKRFIAPEYFGKEAKEYNTKLVSGKRVRLEFDIEREDKYNRLLAYVYVNGVFVNAKLIEEGYGRLMVIPPNTKYADEFLKLEQEAKEAKKGLWAD